MSDEVTDNIDEKNPLAGARVMLFEDDAMLVEVFRRLLRSLDCRVRVCDSPEELPDAVRNAAATADVCCCGIGFTGNLIRDLLESCRTAVPPVPVVVLADYALLQQADALVRSGAFARLAKPIRSGQLLNVVSEALTKRNAGSAKIRRHGTLSDGTATENPDNPQNAAHLIPLHFGSMVGESLAMQELYNQISKIGATDMGVLIQGESGVGKELAARAIHHESKRARGPFVAVNCASLPQTLLESELFGHLKGAFTGAVRDKSGLFLAANNGTLFLDEIGSIPEATQLALLRALQESEIRPVGSTSTIRVNVRIVAATNENVEKLVREGRLREDLYYRISAFPLRIPPLRERKGDIERLCCHFLAALQAPGTVAYSLDEAALQALAAYSWPGNVRELGHLMQRLVAFAPKNGRITLEQLPDAIRLLTRDNPPLAQDCSPDQDEAVPEMIRRTAVPLPKMSLKAYLRQCERLYISKVLEAYDGDKETAARILGISVSTLYRKQET